MATVIHQIGLSKLTVHSPSEFLSLSPDDKKVWLRDESEAGNMIVKRIVEIVSAVVANTPDETKNDSNKDSSTT